MFRLRSITFRIIALHIIAIAVTAIALPITLNLFMDSAIRRLHFDAIREQAEWLARHLQHNPDGKLTLDLPTGLRDLFSAQYGRYTYAVLDAEGRVLFSSDPDRAPVFPADGSSIEDQTEDSNAELRTVRRGSKTIEGASIRKDVDGIPIWVQLGEDLAHRDVVLDDVTAQFLQKAGLITIPILLILLLADIVIVRHAMASLLRASASAKEISPLRIDVRLPENDTPEEILPLVRAVNQALDRLEQGFNRQREFTADAAHELRTPLAVLRTRIETLPDRDVARALHRDLEIMSRVVSQLLESAEVETLIVDPHETSELHDVCRSVAEFVATIALSQNKSITLTGTKGPVWVKGNPEILNRAIRNLVENAIRHTAEGTTVEIIVKNDGSVAVLDRGQGIRPEQRDFIFKRFGSRDRQRTGGAGLGLSIVKSIVESYGGSISVENRTAGGAKFKLNFQLASRDT